MSIMNVYLFWLLFESFLFTPSNTGGDIFINKGYDSDFIPFMKKMFSGFPGQANIDQEKGGPNIGYRPYWYGYGYALHGAGKQRESRWDSSHEDWDYGLGMGSGKGLWGGGSLSLMAAAPNDVVGAAQLLDKDLASETEQQDCFPNLGKNCKLGPPPSDYSAALLESLRQRTLKCDVCSEKHETTGLVCTVALNGVTQEMDMCVKEKMNCLKGTAYLKNNEWRNWKKFQKYPFAMKPQWARISIRGIRDAEIKLFNTVPYEIALYWIIVFGWPYEGPKSVIYADMAEPSWDHPDFVFSRIDRYWGWGWALNNRNFTEYSIVWNPQNGWFLLSQPRAKNWQNEFNIEYVDPKPRDFLYIDAASGWSGHQLEYILHDLTVLHNGPCGYNEFIEKRFPSDTEEVREDAGQVEQAFEKRMHKLQDKGYKPQEWSADEGSYVEY